MIEARTTTFGWAGTANNSDSQKMQGGVVVGTNEVRNPNATGTTTSLTGAVPSAYTGMQRTRAYKATAATAAVTEFGQPTSEQPAAAPGDAWWGHALLQADPTVRGARRCLLALSFLDAVGGNVIGTQTSEVVIQPDGVLYRWTGTANASSSERWEGTEKRVNEIPNPNFNGTTTAWTQISTDVTLGQANNVLTITATAAIPAGTLLASSPKYTVPTGTASTRSSSLTFKNLTDIPLDLRFKMQTADAPDAAKYSALGTIEVPPGTESVQSVEGFPLDAANTGYTLQVITDTDLDVGDSFTVARVISEVGDTAGDFFYGAMTSTGTGNDNGIYEIQVDGVAPAGTKAVRLSVFRLDDFQATAGDILWLGDLALIKPNELTGREYFDGSYPETTEYVNIDRPGSITTDEWVEIDGVPLNTLAYNITTWGSSRQSPPPFRGANTTVPGRPGQQFQERELDAADWGVSMWVQGTETDGTLTDRSLATTFNRNWSALRRLLFQIDREVEITKRWYDYDTNSVKTATARGVYSGGLEPTMTGRARAVFSVSFTLSVPFFYEPTKSVPDATAVKNTWVVDLEGDWKTTAITATIRGPRVKPRFTVTRADGKKTLVTYPGTIAAGESLAIDVDSFAAKLTAANGTTRGVSGSVTHSGHKFWMVLAPGRNTIVLQSDSGTGPVSLSYMPVWF